ncbi:MULTISPECIES: hypothetical protein [unclassified Winogradskyella]|uniref:hypothetical protein n=1 Tax=unclassified Winogradskyella TaxID=2615021 RepID=UPI0018DF5F1C|nr:MULTISPECIES: hypothetical protein [unclassified Winogradskyella]
MNKGFLIIGGIIFAVYIYFTFWNIFNSHKKQKENHYPNLTEKEINESYEESNNL